MSGLYNNDNDEIDDMLLGQVIESSLEEFKKYDLPDSFSKIETPFDKSNDKSNEFIANLWQLAEESIEPLIYSKCQINVNAKISDQDVVFIIDTGAQGNVMTLSTVERLGLESFVDKNIKGQMYGIGTGKMLGIIPYLEIKFGNISCAANFYVMDNPDRKNCVDESGQAKEIDVLLGFPFMMFYKTKLDFSRSKMEIMGNEIDIVIKEF